MQTHDRFNPPRAVAELRAGAAANEELAWFFERALSEIEVPSNYPSMVRRLLCGRRRLARDTRQADDGGERRAEAMHAARIIYDRLDELRSYDRWVICTLYTPAVWPAELEEEWGWLTPLVCALPATEKRFERARRRAKTTANRAVDWLADAVRLFGPEPFRDLAEQAQATAAGAMLAYESKRRRPGSVVPCDRDEEDGR